MMQPYVLSRNYSDVGMYLPPLIDQVIKIELTPEHRRMYDNFRFNWQHQDITANNVMELMHALRIMTACTEKFDATIGVAQDLPGFVIFTDYKSSAARLAHALDATLINGDVPPADRNKIAQQTNKIVATMDSLREGVDLSHIRACLFFEEDYTYGVMYQALSRMRRYNKDGREDPIVCYYMNCHNTIDTVIHSVNTRRTVSAKEVVKAALG